jgi:hypothetical protein
MKSGHFVRTRIKAREKVIERRSHWLRRSFVLEENGRAVV